MDFSWYFLSVPSENQVSFLYNKYLGVHTQSWIMTRGKQTPLLTQQIATLYKTNNKLMFTKRQYNDTEIEYLSYGYP